MVNDSDLMRVATSSPGRRHRGDIVQASIARVITGSPPCSGRANRMSVVNNRSATWMSNLTREIISQGPDGGIVVDLLSRGHATGLEQPYDRPEAWCRFAGKHRIRRRDWGRDPPQYSRSHKAEAGCCPHCKR